MAELAKLPGMDEMNEAFRTASQSMTRVRGLIEIYMDYLEQAKAEPESGDPRVDVNIEELGFLLSDVEELFEDLHEKWGPLNACLTLVYARWAELAPKDKPAEEAEHEPEPDDPVPF